MSAAGTRRYELQAVLLLSVGFGFVGIDRFMIVPLLPIISRSLGFDYKDLGLVTGALSLGWGVAAILFGRASDVVGRRRIVGFAMESPPFWQACSPFTSAYDSFSGRRFWP